MDTSSKSALRTRPSEFFFVDWELEASICVIVASVLSHSAEFADASIGLCVCLASVTHILAILAWSRSAEALFVHLSQRTDLAALWGVLCVVD
jgi:hypothetical protein